MFDMILFTLDNTFLRWEDQITNETYNKVFRTMNDLAQHRSIFVGSDAATALAWTEIENRNFNSLLRRIKR